jgi:HEAT repeat protein
VDYRPNPRSTRAFDKEAVDKAFEALKTFDWSMNFNEVLLPIDDAVVASNGNAAQRKDLETRLTALLKTNVSRAAKDFTLRELGVIGTPISIPAIAELLTDKDSSHMARYALERIGGPEAAAAMRAALPKVSGALKAGMIESIGALRDGESVSAMVTLSGDSDQTLAFAAINALGKIGTPEAAKALSGMVKKAPDAQKLIAADASLVCAERLLADGKKAEAMDLYKGLSGEDQPKHVRLAATRGLLASAAKQ